MTLSFPPGLDWFNSPPLSWERHLLGKVVLLDFWTFCCINCMHTLPDVARLLAKYEGRPLAAVGVHSAKFSYEKVGDHVREAMIRYGVHHPVVNDPEMILWKRLGVRAWPTLALFDPAGQLVQLYSGEGRADEIDREIARLLDQWPAEELSKAPLPLKGEQPSQNELLYPGKVIHHPTDDLLFVSDTGHHQIVVQTPEGEILRRLEVGFHLPQGLAYRANKLYVADTGNHRLAVIDLESGEAATLAEGLRSPWDLELVGHCLYIAMAGSHQIWIYDLLTGRAKPYSGSGAELHLNSSHPNRTGWAQPSGLTYGNGLLYIADSESSAIRALDPVTKSSKTIAGGDPSQPHNLFIFGDRDGVGDEVRFQHPLGVAWHEQKRRLIVADSYNNKLKWVDPVTGSVETFLGGFAEPGGVAVSPDGRRIFVADTNRCRIRWEGVDGVD